MTPTITMNEPFDLAVDLGRNTIVLKNCVISELTQEFPEHLRQTFHGETIILPSSSVPAIRCSIISNQHIYQPPQFNDIWS